MADFQKSKSIGKFGENLVSNYLRLGNVDVTLNEDKETRSHYDLLCRLGNKKFTVEVKLDFLASKTQNLAIEISNTKTGVDSGLTASKSTLWAVLVKDEENWVVFLTKTETLRDYIKKNKGREFKGAGDGNATLLLYKMQDILYIFKRIDNLGKLVDGVMDYSDIGKVVKGLLK